MVTVLFDHGNVTAALLTMVMLSALSWVLASFLLYSLYQFQTLKNGMIIIKRRGDIVIKAATCAIISFTFSYPYTIVIYVLSEEDIMAQNHNELSQAVILADDVVWIPYYIGLFLILLRYWFMYYDIQSSKSCLNLQWKVCINSKIQSTPK